MGYYLLIKPPILAYSTLLIQYQIKIALAYLVVLTFVLYGLWNLYLCPYYFSNMNYYDECQTTYMVHVSQSNHHHGGINFLP